MLFFKGKRKLCCYDRSSSGSHIGRVERGYSPIISVGIFQPKLGNSDKERKRKNGNYVILTFFNKKNIHCVDSKVLVVAYGSNE